MESERARHTCQRAAANARRSRDRRWEQRRHCFHPNAGSHTFTGPCVWVWCHPAAGAFLCDQMCADRAASFPGDSSYGTGEGGGSNKRVPATHEQQKKILGAAPEIFFFHTFVTRSHVRLLKCLTSVPILPAKVSGSPWNKSGPPKKC